MWKGEIEMEKMLIAIDGSPTSLLALKEARQMSDQFLPDIQIMTVISRGNVYAYAYPPAMNQTFEEEAVKNAKLMMEEAEKIFDGYPKPVEKITVHGDAADEILKQVEADTPDLLVMGSRGMGTFQRLMLGSVVTKVANHVCCNMLIIRQCDI
jgi:nucleotide-binding universal stress UspA family protein